MRGSVIPDAPGTFIFLERRTPRGWASIGMDVLDRESRFRMLAPSCDEWYRVRWPSQHEDNLGKIKLFRLRGEGLSEHEKGARAAGPFLMSFVGQAVVVEVDSAPADPK